jgi:hypothetical protein
MLRRVIERKTEDVLGKYHFVFGRRKRARGTTGDAENDMKRILDTDEKLRACFTDWFKAFERVNWTE